MLEKPDTKTQRYKGYFFCKPAKWKTLCLRASVF